MDNRDKALKNLVNVLDTDFLTALAEPVRIEILKKLLSPGKKDIAAIADNMPQDRSVVSRHLNQMYKAGLLKKQKIQRNVYYEIDAKNCIGKFRDMLNHFELAVEKCCPIESP